MAALLKFIAAGDNKLLKLNVITQTKKWSEGITFLFVFSF